jgi:transposase
LTFTNFSLQYSKMVRGKELTVGKPAQVMLLKELGFSQRHIAARLKVSRCAVQRCFLRCKEPIGEEHQSKKRSGRPKITSSRTDNAIIMMCKRSSRSSSTKIKSQLPASESVSTRMIRRRLFASGLKACRPAKKPLLSSKNIRDRLAFCRKYKQWTSEQ